MLRLSQQSRRSLLNLPHGSSGSNLLISATYPCQYLLYARRSSSHTPLRPPTTQEALRQSHSLRQLPPHSTRPVPKPITQQARAMATTAQVGPPPPPAVTTAGDLVEAAKRAAGQRAVAEHLRPEYTHVGIGSGSTIKYVVEAIAALPAEQTARMKFVPTGIQSRDLIRTARLPLLAIDDMVMEKPYSPGQQYLDVCFDGADEVDLELNLIKGGGGCHYQEKLVAISSKKFVCVADYRKKVDRLLTNWPGVPIEVQPLWTERVRRQLISLGSPKPIIRSGLPGKAGPAVTDNGNHIIDAPFPPLLLNNEAGKADAAAGFWTPEALLARIKEMEGVLAVGLFTGYNGPQALAAGKEALKPMIVYFGMEDGSVETRQ